MESWKGLWCRHIHVFSSIIKIPNHNSRQFNSSSFQQTDALLQIYVSVSHCDFNDNNWCADEFTLKDYVWGWVERVTELFEVSSVQLVLCNSWKLSLGLTINYFSPNKYFFKKFVIWEESHKNLQNSSNRSLRIFFFCDFERLRDNAYE